jgi:DNA repair photolyase
MDNLAPRMEKRFAAMEQIARAGILTGIMLMPILPGPCDTGENLEATIRCTANHGGRFVLAGRPCDPGFHCSPGARSPSSGAAL